MNKETEKMLGTVIGHGVNQTFKVELPRFSSHGNDLKDKSLLQQQF